MVDIKKKPKLCGYSSSKIHELLSKNKNFIFVYDPELFLFNKDATSDIESIFGFMIPLTDEKNVVVDFVSIEFDSQVEMEEYWKERKIAGYDGKFYCCMYSNSVFIDENT